MAVLTVNATYDDLTYVDFILATTSSLYYQVNIPDGLGGMIPNPQTRAQFLQARADDLLKSWLEQLYKQEKDRQTLAAAAAANTIDVT